MNSNLDLAEMDRRFGIPGVARVCEGNGGLGRVTITSSEAKGEIYLHGAQVTSWCPRTHEEVLFVSSKARWQDGQAIRGGIPICFPWFGPKADDSNAPAHGFARIRTWQLESIVEKDAGVVVTVFTQSDEFTRRWWPAEFHLVHRATFGSDLRLELICRNTGNSPLRFEEALHTYNRIKDIANVELQGLKGAQYLDTIDSNRQKTQVGNVTFASRTDNAFVDTPTAVTLTDPGLRRRIRLEKTNSHSTVVWNPWSDTAAKMQDLGEGEWRHFLCVEGCNIMDSAVTLGPGEEHKMTALLSTERL